MVSDQLQLVLGSLCVTKSGFEWLKMISGVCGRILVDTFGWLRMVPGGLLF